MKALKLIALFIANVILIISGCKPDKDPVHVIRLIPEELKQYIDFKEGSYWVYQDSATGEIDTVKVLERINYDFEGQLSHNEADATCEYLEIRTLSSRDSFNYDYWVNTSYSGTKYKDINAIFESKYNKKSNEGTHKSLIYPFIKGNWIFIGNGISADSVVIEGTYPTLKEYSDVIKVGNIVNFHEANKVTFKYFARGIGKIRYEIPSVNRVDTLVSYNILP